MASKECTVKLTYFTRGGKFYAAGEYRKEYPVLPGTNEPCLYTVQQDVRRAVHGIVGLLPGEFLPGLAGREWKGPVLVTVGGADLIHLIPARADAHALVG